MKSLAFPFLIFIAFPVCAQTIIYVDQKAVAGAQTGADWANAFPDLQQALAQAGAGDSIWVAAGVYKPTSTPERTISFDLVDGVCLYGGFAGTETALSQRNIDGYKTVLSGDIGELQVPADNSYHVLRGKGNNQIVANHAIAEDLDGLPRIRYGIVDLGAYEQQDSCTIISAEEADRQQPLLIWANPSADGMLNVRIPDAAVRVGLLQVFNLQGQEVFRSQQPGSSAIWHLALEDLPRGFYTIRLKTLAGPCFVGKWMRL